MTDAAPDNAVATAGRSDDRPPISCYIRTLNEAERIGEVIAAASRVAREVIVVDSGSSDETQAIARRHGARVIENAWPGNGHQKRVGEDACANDWLLDLDADEVVTAELAASITKLFAAGPPADSVYALCLVVKVPVAPVWDKFFLTYRNKLYDRRVWRMPAHAAWDQLDLPKSSKPQRLDGRVIHHTFTDFRQLVGKMNSVSSTRARYTKPRSKAQLRLRIFGGLPVYFFKHYALRGLYRGGTYGFACAVQFAHTRWLRDVKMYEAVKRDELGKVTTPPTRP